MWALVKDKTILKFPYSRMDLKKDNPNVGFPKEIGESTLAFYDVKVVHVDQTIPFFNETTEKIVTNEVPEWEGDTLVVRNKVVPKTQEEMEEALQIKAAKVRQQRNRLLSESDWLVVYYSEGGFKIPKEVKAYRDNLRDITNQSGFPSEVVWPEKPEELK